MQFLIVATVRETGALAYVQKPYRHKPYSFGNGYRHLRNPKHVRHLHTLETATRFSGEDAIDVLEQIENNLGHLQNDPWVMDWRIVPAPQ